MRKSKHVGPLIRIVGRSFWLAGELAWGACAVPRKGQFHSEADLAQARAKWLQRVSRRLVRVFNLGVYADGSIPSRGVLISNHLSYLDIVVICSLVPCVFVAKREVAQWPVFGWFARVAGTIFTHRERRMGAASGVEEIDRVLESGALIVLFPEGTSSGGDTVLPFKSALLEPATRTRHPLHTACLRYELEGGNVRDEVCYWRDMTLLPHLLNLLGKRAVTARISFQPHESCADRKELSRRLHAQIHHMMNYVPSPQGAERPTRGEGGRDEQDEVCPA